ncbi:hypothetical protein GH714_013498 [Hevea brasiliensis]|uniref:Protein kinase domain-containing protein n=1 Tax=Hevea brasiliensis TaxID=3981 RepID=A0A6A6MZ86_HEVBR|nr:hypothetical protein GH714_013498 [Hevea brasiliensis]
MAESLHIDVKQDDNGSEKADRFDQKVSSLERIFLIANFILELPSAAFDQLSSVHKPQYALLSMLISFSVLIISIIDLVHKGRKERVNWMRRGLIPWFYYPYPNPKPFGTFPDIIGLACAAFQCVFAAISYAFFCLHADIPIKVSVWPIIFAFGLLYSRLSGNTTQKRPNPHVRRLNRAEELTLAQLAAATNARVCDFGMSVLGSESESNHKLEKAAGTVGYIDPEFYSRNVLTTKSDVYSLGVVLLELLTGKRAIFKDEDNGDAIKSIVDFATTKILANELVKVLDHRIGPPEHVKEAEAIELFAYTALHCVNLEGNNRPSITNIVANLEQASSLCDVHNEGLPIDAEQLHGRSRKRSKLQWNRETSLGNFRKATIILPRNAQLFLI